MPSGGGEGEGSGWGRGEGGKGAEDDRRGAGKSRPVRRCLLSDRKGGVPFLREYVKFRSHVGTYDIIDTPFVSVEGPGSEGFQGGSNFSPNRKRTPRRPPRNKNKVRVRRGRSPGTPLISSY